LSIVVVVVVVVLVARTTGSGFGPWFPGSGSVYVSVSGYMALASLS